MTKKVLTNKLDIINGQFTPQEAKDILLHLYGMKINFHEQKNYASMERFGVYDETALKRIPELRASINRVKKIIADAEMNDLKLVITSQINIDLVVQPLEELKVA